MLRARTLTWLLGEAVLAACLAIGAPLPPVLTDPPPPPPATDRTRVRFLPGHYPSLPLPDGLVWPVRSLLDIRHPMRFGDYVWNTDHIPQGPSWIRVDLGKQTLSVFRAGHEIGAAVILFGTDGKPTPDGLFRILERSVQHRSSLYDAEMPYMLRLTNDGVAIHASNVREGYATHGCIGIPLAFARLLYAQVQKGTPVAIVPA